MTQRRQNESSIKCRTAGQPSLPGTVSAEALQYQPTLRDPMNCSLPGSSVLGILQARLLEWVTIPFLRGSSHPGFKPRSPALQADSLPSEPSVKGRWYLKADKETKAQNVPDSHTPLLGTPWALALPLLACGTSPSLLSVCLTLRLLCSFSGFPTASLSSVLPRLPPCLCSHETVVQFSRIQRGACGQVGQGELGLGASHCRTLLLFSCQVVSDSL